MEIEAAAATDADAVAAVFKAARDAAMPWLPVLHGEAEDRRFFAGVIAGCEVLVVRREGHVVAFVALGNELVEHLYDQDFDRDSNTIEVFVGRIRKKLGVDVIQTVRGLGYLLTPPNA